MIEDGCNLLLARYRIEKAQILHKSALKYQKMNLSKKSFKTLPQELQGSKTLKV